MDIATALAQDHERVRRLLSEIEIAQPGERTQLLARLEQEVRIHARVEEDLFYPSMREAADNDDERLEVAEGYEAHHAADLLFTEIKQVDPGTEQFNAKLAVLKEMIEHHAQEEETTMFTRARERFTAEELGNLGTAVMRMREQLQKEYPAPDRGFTQAKAAGAAARKSR